jgi:hypothetical protein
MLSSCANSIYLIIVTEVKGEFKEYEPNHQSVTKYLRLGIEESLISSRMLL